jgi:hypothetical protein
MLEHRTGYEGNRLAMKLKVTTKKYSRHVVVRIEVDGHQRGYVQIETDNLAYYGPTVNGCEVYSGRSMVMINYPKAISRNNINRL